MCVKSTVSAHGRGLNAIISRQCGQVYPWGEYATRHPPQGVL